MDNVALYAGGIKLLWLLVVAHILCDFQLQGTQMSQLKNHKSAQPNMPWWIVLGAHGLIQGAAVMLITGSVALGATETVAHVSIDYIKNDGRISFRTDQILHVLLKVAYVVYIAEKGTPL